MLMCHWCWTFFACSHDLHAFFQKQLPLDKLIKDVLNEKSLNQWSNLLYFTFCFSSNFKKSEDPAKWGSESLELRGNWHIYFIYIYVNRFILFYFIYDLTLFNSPLRVLILLSLFQISITIWFYSFYKTKFKFILNSLKSFHDPNLWHILCHALHDEQ